MADGARRSTRARRPAPIGGDDFVGHNAAVRTSSKWSGKRQAETTEGDWLRSIPEGK